MVRNENTYLTDIRVFIGILAIEPAKCNDFNVTQLTYVFFRCISPNHHETYVDFDNIDQNNIY